MPPLSTQNLVPLPDIARLRALMQSLAVLDAVMSPEWEGRLYSFDANWSGNEQMGSMRTGTGDELFTLFTDAGCFIKGFSHESIMSPYQCDPPKIWSGVLDDVPKVFNSGLTEPAFSMADVTFCIWRCQDDEGWAHGPIAFPEVDDPDGSEALLWMLDGSPERYQHFAEEYYEVNVPLEAIRHIYGYSPLSSNLVSSLNADVNLEDLAAELRQIGYPNTVAT